MRRTVKEILNTVIFLILCNTPLYFFSDESDPLANLPSDVTYIQDEVIVKFKDAAPLDASYDIERALNAEKIKSLLENNTLVQYELPTGLSVSEAILQLQNEMDVAYAEPNFIVHINNTPNDPSFGNLWGLQNTGQSGGTAGVDIDATTAWNMETGSGSVIVAVIDTGVDYHHPDLAQNMWTNPGEIASNGIDDDANGIIDDVHGANFVPATATGDPMDDHYHGTHCAGTIGAVGNNSVGIVGVAWNVKIMAVKFLNSSGSGSIADAISSVLYATQMGAHILSNSWGGGGYSQALKDVIATSNQANCLFVAAAGNDASNADTSPHYPSSYEVSNIISVAATDRNDQLASFSNYGLQSVDLGAPGVSIYSTKPNNQYGYLSGTSMATPHVSGAAALIKSYYPNYTNLQIKNLLFVTAEPIASLQGKTVTGARLNIANLFETDTTPPAPITDLTVISSQIGISNITLEWTNSGDDNITGQASLLDIRYSTTPITNQNFQNAPTVVNEPVPDLSGTHQTMSIANLSPNTTYYFAVKVLDNLGNVSLLSNVAQATTLTANIVYAHDVEHGTDGITITGTNGNSGPALWHVSTHRNKSSSHAWYYGQESSLDYNTGQINYGSLIFNNINLINVSNPQLTFWHWLQTENYASYDKATISISTNGTNWTTVWTAYSSNNIWENPSIDLSSYSGQTISISFSFNTVDSLYNNFEGWYVDDVMILGANIVDETAPAAINNLSIPSVTTSSIRLTWSAPGDDGIYGQANQYELRYHTAPINETNWSTCALASNMIAPATAGTSENFQVQNLNPNQTYYFAIKTQDEVGNTSNLSNVISGSTLENIVPNTIQDLTIINKTKDTLTLQWTASGDDAGIGTAHHYDIRYAQHAINESNWSSATSINNAPTPSEPGQQQTCTISNLNYNTLYYIAIKVVDDASNISNLSNVVSDSTLSPATLVLDDSQIQNVHLTLGKKQTQTLSITNTGDEPLSFTISEMSHSSTISSVQPASNNIIKNNEEIESAPQELLIKYLSTTSSTALEQLLNDVDAEIIHQFPVIHVSHIRIASYRNTDEAIAYLRNNPLIEYAEPNYVVKSIQQPNDPSFNNLYGLHNTGQTGGTVDSDIDAIEAWSLTQGSSSITVGIIDSGVDYTHPDLAQNIWTNPNEIPNNGIDDDSNGYIDDMHGYDFANHDSDPYDDNSHGTHVAGTIGAVGNNNIGVVGVNWNVRIMALKFLGDDGSGYISGALEAVLYAVQNHAHLTNNSWGGGGYSQSLKDAIDYAGTQNQLFIAAAGNSNEDNDISPMYPGAYTSLNIIAVAACDDDDQKASFSSYGVHSTDLFAPGVNILSTVPDNGYEYYSGTSMATPHVSGACALVWSQNLGLTAEQIKTRILNNVDQKTQFAGLVSTGGRLNVYNALQSEDDSVPPSAVTNLTYVDSSYSTVNLTWTCSGDDGLSGIAYNYDLRYSKNPIDASNFAQAAQVYNTPAPLASGETQSCTVSGLKEETDYYFALKVIDNAQNLSTISNIVTATTQKAQTYWIDNFDHGNPQWSIHNIKGSQPLWHLTSYKSYSQNYALGYFQDNQKSYDIGEPTAGSVTSPEINLKNISNPSLNFQYYRDVEFNMGSYDQTYIEISPDNGQNWHMLWSKSSMDASENKWTPSGNINLSDFSGQKILLRFTFDSVDYADNIHLGWIVDNIRIIGNISTLEWIDTAPTSGTLAKNETQSITITYSANQIPGIYSGNIYIQSTAHGQTEISVPLQMTITNEYETPEDLKNVALGKPAFAHATLSPEYNASCINDGLSENDGIHKSWLLPDYKNGGAYIDLKDNYKIYYIRFKNTVNAPAYDRSTKAWSIKIKNQTDPYWTTILSKSEKYSMDPPWKIHYLNGIKARYIKFSVDKYWGKSGGLLELEVYGKSISSNKKGKSKNKSQTKNQIELEIQTLSSLSDSSTSHIRLNLSKDKFDGCIYQDGAYYGAWGNTIPAHKFSDLTFQQKPLAIAINGYFTSFYSPYLSHTESSITLEKIHARFQNMGIIFSVPDKNITCHQFLDFNHDGLLDLLVGYENGKIETYLNQNLDQATTFVYHDILRQTDGTPLPIENCQSIMALTHTDSQLPELLIATNHSILKAKDDGTHTYTLTPVIDSHGHDIVFEDTVHSSTMLDLNNNGKIEMYTATDNGNLFKKSQLLSSYPYLSGWKIHPIALNQQGTLLWLVALPNGQLYFLNHKTGHLTALQISTAISDISSLSITDLNHDSQLEIIVTDHNGNFHQISPQF